MVVFHVPIDGEGTPPSTGSTGAGSNVPVILPTKSTAPLLKEPTTGPLSVAPALAQQPAARSSAAVATPSPFDVPVRLPGASSPAPAAPSLLSVPRIQTQGAQSTTAVPNAASTAAQGVDPFDLAHFLITDATGQDNAPIKVRPAFGREGSEQTINGIIPSTILNIVSRTLEIVPKVAAFTASNFSPEQKVKLPFDKSRLGFEDQFGGSGSELESTGARLIQDFQKRMVNEPDQRAKNIALSVIGIPIADAFDAFFAGDILAGAAKQTLRVTGFKPEVSAALDTLNLKGSEVTVDTLKQNFAARAENILQKYSKEIKAWQESGEASKQFPAAAKAELDQLGQSANILAENLANENVYNAGYAAPEKGADAGVPRTAPATFTKGKGIPELNRFGSIIQDIAATGLSTVKNGVQYGVPHFDPVGTKEVPQEQSLPGYRVKPGQAPAFGLSTEEIQPVGFGADKGAAAPEQFAGFNDLSTSVLERLKGRTTVSKQYISDLLRGQSVRESERALISKALEGEGEQVNVKAFAEKVKTELLPLERSNKVPDFNSDGARNDYGGKIRTGHEMISLPDKLRGDVADYHENVYSSPIKVEAGSVHYGKSAPNYFAHTRVEDMADGTTRRVIEGQSDLFQKDRLEGEANPMDLQMARKRLSDAQSDLRTARKIVPEDVPKLEESVAKLQAQVNKLTNPNRPAEIAKLDPYRDTWHERIIPEELRAAAKDGKAKVQFPTGETAMKVEGLGGETASWSIGLDNSRKVTPEDLKVGETIYQATPEEMLHGSGDQASWVITDVKGDGKFGAIPKSQVEKYGSIEEALRNAGDRAENFDIAAKIDTTNPIYKFYESEVGKYLQKKYGATRVTDPQGVQWWEVDLAGKGYDKKPILAFGGDHYEAPVPKSKPKTQIDAVRAEAKNYGSGKEFATALSNAAFDAKEFAGESAIGLEQRLTEKYGSPEKYYDSISGKPVEDVVPYKPVLETELPADADPIERAEQQVRNAYRLAGPAVDNPGISKAADALERINILMETSMPGRRDIISNKNAPGSTVIASHSTFPKWVPEDMRDMSLFRKVFGPLRSIDTLAYPAGRATKQRELFDAILGRLDYETGVDTSEQRKTILNEYERTQETGKPRRARDIGRGGFAGGEGAGAIDPFIDQLPPNGMEGSSGPTQAPGPRQTRGKKPTATELKTQSERQAPGMSQEANPVPFGIAEKGSVSSPLTVEQDGGGVKPPTVRGGITPPEMDFSKWKDKQALSLSRETLERNIDDVATPEDAKKLKEFIVDPVRKNETARIEFVNSERTKMMAKMDELGIKKGTPADRYVQLLGEGAATIADAEKAAPGQLENIQKAVSYFRNVYDGLLELVNDERLSFGYSPIPKRPDYFRHFRELDTSIRQFGLVFRQQDLPTEISGITDIFRPGKPFTTAELRRMGTDTSVTAIGGMDNYLESVSKQAWHIDSVQRGRALEKYIRESAVAASEAGTPLRLPNFVANVSDYTNRLAGKKSRFDRALESLIGRPIYAFVDLLRKRVGANLVGANFSSAITNFLPLTQLLSTTGKAEVTAALFANITAPFVENPAEIDGVKSSFLTRRFPIKAAISKPLEKASEVAGWLFDAIDRFTARSIVMAKYRELVGNGMESAAAMKQADEYAGKLIADRSFGNTPNLFDNKSIGIITQFQLEVNNLYSFLKKDIPDMAEGDRKKILWMLAQFVLYSYLFNEVYEKVNGRRPTIDPIYAALTLAGLNDAGKGLTPAARAKKAALDIGENLPYSGLFIQGGRFPVSSAIPNVPGIADGTANPVEELKKPLFGLLPPFGGAQLRKTIEGLTAFKEGSVDTKKGAKAFNIEPTILNAVKMGLFGKSASTDAVRYYQESDRIYSIIDKQKSDRAKVTDEAEAAYQNLKLIASGKDGKAAANKAFAEIDAKDSALADKILDIADSEQKGLTGVERLIKQLGVENGERAKYIATKMKELPDNKAKQNYFNELDQKGLISDTVYDQVVELINKDAKK